MPKRIGIFLDDEREPEEVTWIDYNEDIDWVVVRTDEEFKEVICEYFLREYFEGIKHELVVSFDHDLQLISEGVETTGYDLLKWMLDFAGEWEIILPKCFFHTKNIIGKKNMESYWNNYLKHIGGLK